MRLSEHKWAMGLLAVAVALTACGKQPSSASPWPGDRHDSAKTGGSGGRRFPAATPAEAERRLSDALEAQQDFEAVVYANRLVAAGGELSPVRYALIATAVDALRADHLAAVWKELDPVAPAELVAMRLALLAKHRGEDDRALELLARVSGNQELERRAGALKQRIRARREVDADTVAVLLPLSGRYSRIGEEMRAAIELAARRRGDAKLRFLDTEGDAGLAVAAVDKAVYEHHAIAIIGPVGELEGQAAAARAAELGVPIALLSPGDRGGAPRVGVFRLWSSPEWEAREAVRLVTRVGYDRLAILAPRDDQGEAQTAAFRAAATEFGARLVAVGSYDPTATALEPDLKEFLGLDPKTNERLRRHLRRKGRKQGWKSFSPEVEFDLLFIPDVYERAALVAAYLPFFNVEVRSQDVMDIVGLKRKHGGRVPQVVQLLGSSGWHHESLIPRGGEVLEGALVLDVFSGGDNEEYGTDAGAEFAEAFRARYGRQPGSLAAQTHDAALLVLGARAGAAKARHRDPRAAFVRELRGARLNAGACGPTEVSGTGELVRNAVLLRVDGGAFVLHEY